MTAFGLPQWSVRYSGGTGSRLVRGQWPRTPWTSLPRSRHAQHRYALVETQGKIGVTEVAQSLWVFVMVLYLPRQTLLGLR